MKNRNRELLIDGIHLFVAANFAFAQPLYDLLSRNAEFFVARHSRPIDVLLMAVGLSLLVPAIFLLVERLVAFFGERIRWCVHCCLLGALLAIVLLPVVKPLHAVAAWLPLFAAVGFGIALGIAYWRVKPLRSPFYLWIMALAGLMFPAHFLLVSPASAILFPKGAPGAASTKFETMVPVVMVVFDEFPVTSLMDEDGLIDSIRYPNFAVFGAGADWYRNTRTPTGDTLRAVPAILTGMSPKRSRHKSLPTARDYPENLFTLLGGSHRLEVFESVTELCPVHLCGEEPVGSFSERLWFLFHDLSVLYLHIVLPPNLSSSLPAVTQTWKAFGGTPRGADADGSVHANEQVHEKFARFVRSIGRGREPALYFIHIVAPHLPWRYLPSGKRYTKTRTPGLQLRGEMWDDNEWLVLQAYQRHLLQVGYVDHLLGELLEKLRSADLYDRSLIVLTADHGANFWPGKSRRGAVKDFPREINGVPLFIKAPHQESGSIRDLHARTTDIVPTIADILGVSIPWPVDGVSIHEKASAPADAFDARAYAPLKRKLRIFGSGSEPGQLFKIGPHNELIGREVGRIGVTKEASVGSTIDQAVRLANLDLHADVIPAHITGSLIGTAGEDSTFELAISVNGTVRAVTRSHWENDEARFSAMIPEDALVRGANDVGVFIISEGVGGIVLERCSHEANPVYSLRLSTEPDSSGKIGDLVKPDGGSIPIVRSRMVGFVSSSMPGGEGVNFSGWAANTKAKELPSDVVMFVDGRLWRGGWTRMQRTDLVNAFGDDKFLEAGFRFTVPSSLLDASEVRVFAISKEGVATELEYVIGYGYRRVARYELEKSTDNEEWMNTRDGVRIPILPGAITTSLEAMTGNSLLFHGWTADTTNFVRARAVVVFANGAFVHAVETNRESPVLVEGPGSETLRWSGFSFALPEAYLADPTPAEIRLFAVSASGAASEFNYPEGYPWGRGYSFVAASGTGPDQLVAADGRSIPVTMGAMSGSVVHSFNDHGLVVRGWALDAKNGELPESIVVFENGEFLLAGHTHLSRQDVVERFDNESLLWSGFLFTTPAERLQNAETSEIRTFAVSKTGIASELKVR